MVWILLAAFAAFAAVLVVRTLRFKPEAAVPVKEDPIALDRERVIADMQAMIRCKTVSYNEESLIDYAEFEKFADLLRDRYPLIHQRCTMERVGKTGLLYRLAGKSSENPSVCMAHYDVVPIEEDGWVKPAFDAIIEDGVLWGRGTLDTKGTLLGVMEGLEFLLKDGYVPENDLYLAFSGQEEISGPDCVSVVSLLEQRGVTPAIVVDEGGAVVDHVFPGVPQQCALIGIAEKGFMNVKFSMESGGGHASTPPRSTTLVQLAKAITRLEKHPFRRRLTKPVAGMFDTLGRHSTFVYRLIFANLWCFEPVLDLICKKSGGELNAMMRTTVAFTKMEGSKAYNVLPPRASFGVNMRLMAGDTVASAEAYLKRVIKNDQIKLSVYEGMEPSICSSMECGGWEKLTQAVHETWPEAIVSPYLMMACSDSRHYCRITDKVYRFSAMHLSKEERAMIHGNNERVPLDTLIRTVEFYVRLLRKL